MFAILLAAVSIEVWTGSIIVASYYVLRTIPTASSCCKASSNDEQVDPTRVGGIEVDYTVLPIGTKILSSEVVKCPHCGRPGLQQFGSDGPCYLHRVCTDYDDYSHGPRTEFDGCPNYTSSS
jgi:hypothetical protein